MSMNALAWAMKQPVSPPTRKLVLQTLADKANTEGECWPSLATLSEAVGLKERMVRRHITALTRDGYLCAENRGRFSNLYRLNLTGTQIPDKAGTPVPVNEMDNRYSSTPDLKPLTGTPVQLNRYSSTDTSLLTQKNPKTATSAHPDTRTHEAPKPAWLSSLYHLGWADSDRLNDREVQRISSDFGHLDLADELEKFVGYWRKKPRPKTWATYLRLRTWLTNAKRDVNRGRSRHSRHSTGRINPPGPGELTIAANQ